MIPINGIHTKNWFSFALLVQKKSVAEIGTVPNFAIMKLNLAIVKRQHIFHTIL